MAIDSIWKQAPTKSDNQAHSILIQYCSASALFITNSH